MQKPSMAEFVRDTVELLNRCSSNEFAEIYVTRRMTFAREYSQGLISSTAHGANFFSNLLSGKWPEYNPTTRDGESGEYGDNFRKLLKMMKS